jgi:hypothetical protein
LCQRRKSAQTRSTWRRLATSQKREKTVSLKVLKMRSIRPFVQGWAGSVRTWRTPCLARNAATGRARNAGPRSVRRRSGSPCFSNRRREGACDLCARGPADPFERDDAAAVVVDDAQDPDRDEAEDEEEGEVGAPEGERPRDRDAAGPPPSRLLEDGHEVTAADDDLAEGLAGGVEAEDAAGEEAKLAGAELGLLDVEADDLLLDVVVGAVPGSAASRPWGRRGEPVTLEPRGVEAAQGAAPPLDVAREAPAMVIGEEGEPEEEVDDGKAEAVVGAEE